MLRTLRLGFLTVIAVATVLGFGVAPASAHNTFVESSPTDGEVVGVSPTSWSVTFEKSVPLGSASGVVINGDGVRTSLPTPRHGDTDSTIIFEFPPDLSGTIGARWRLIGTDGHVISGRISFTVTLTAVGESGAPLPVSSPGGVPAIPTTDDPFADGEVVRIPEPLRIGLRLASFFFLLLLGGVLFVERFLAERTVTTANGRRLLRVGASGSALIPLAQLGILSVDLGGSLSDALSLTAGAMFVLRAAVGGVIVFAVESLLRKRHEPPRITWHWGALWAMYLVALAYVGHSRSQGLAWLGIPADVLHVTAISAWLGGLAVLLLVVLPLVDANSGVAVMQRFSTFAERAVLVVVVTGIVQTVRLHDSVTNLFTTTHGLLLLFKVGLVLLIIKLAHRNRRLLALHRNDDSASSLHTRASLTKSALNELMLAMVVLVITAVLVGTSIN
jgi:copper transport protein